LDETIYNVFVQLNNKKPFKSKKQNTK